MLLRLQELKIRDVITTINRGMLACTWEELEFRLDVLHAIWCSHCSALSV
jgi:hypothetical protein